MKATLLLKSIIGVAAALSTAQAQLITPVGISSSVAADAGSATENLINSVGLDAGTGNHFWGDHSSSFVTAAIPGFPAKYDFGGQRPSLIVDLGSDTGLAGIAAWAYSGGSGTPMPQANSLKAFTLRFATDAEGPAGFGGSISYNPTFNMNPANLPPGNGTAGFIIPREDFQFVDPVNARWVEMSLDDNFWDDQVTYRGGDRVGFAELRFIAVPEPSTYALFGLGLALLVGRRRWGRAGR